MEQFAQNDFTVEYTLDAALQYRKMGFSIIPLVYGKKTPAIKTWTEYQTELAPIALLESPEWFGGYPRNLGLILGAISGNLCAIDFDNLAVYEKWRESYLDIAAATAQAKTGRGVHLFFKYTGDTLPKNGACEFSGDFLGEIKSEGGYIVAPPSLHPNGVQYEWIRSFEDGIYEISCLDEIGITPRRNKSKQETFCRNALTTSVEKLRQVQEGERNNQLYKTSAALANLLHYSIFSESELIENLTKAGLGLRLPDDEVRQVITNGIKDGKKTPRIIPTSTSGRNKTEGSDLPEVFVSTHEMSIADEVIRLLSKVENLYTRNGQLVHIISEKKMKNIHRPPNSPVIMEVRPPRIRELITSCVRLRKIRDDEPKDAHPPHWLAPAIISRKTWDGLKPLEGIIECPSLRKDGTIITRPGYDESTGLFLASSVEIERIAATPTLDEALESLKTLLEIVVDFPFEKDMHRAAWVAAVLTPFARHTYQGPTPPFIIDANIRGAGKTLLADTCGIVATGQELPKTTYTPDIEESRKQITAVALGGDRHILLDNITGKFANSAYDAAFTATKWKGRLLSTNSSPDMILDTIWYATGNNIEVTSDTSRRSIHMRLLSPSDRPEDRRDLKHSPLVPWVQRNRSRFVTAALTILRAYFAAGKPEPENDKLSEFGSFQGWASVIRNCVIWLGLPDPVETNKELATQSDRETGALESLIAILDSLFPDGAPFATQDIMNAISNDAKGKPKDAELFSAIMELIPTKSGLPAPSTIGKKFRDLKLRPVRINGTIKALDKTGNRGKLGNRWKITSQIKEEHI